MNREEMNNKLNRVRIALEDLVRTDNSSIEVNVRYGLIEPRNYTIKLTEQMTLDAYVDNNEQDIPMSFPVLDVIVHKSLFAKRKDWELIYTPEVLAMMIHKDARKLANYEIR